LLPTTAGKVCASDGLKMIMDVNALLKMNTIPVTGVTPVVTVTAYCADSRMLQVAGLLSAATLVVSSQLVWNCQNQDLYYEIINIRCQD